MSYPETYQERINRWRIVCHEELPEAHKAEYRLHGVNPDEIWKLIWSFETEEAAKEQLQHCIEHAASWQTYKLVDGGKTEFVERKAWF